MCLSCKIRSSTGACMKTRVGLALESTTLRRFGIRFRVPLMICMISLAAVATVMLVPDEVSAASVPYIVEGFVTDSGGSPVLGAVVTVTMRHSGGGSTTHDFTTITGGYYGISFTKDEWNVGDHFDVVATKASYQAENLNNLAEAGAYKRVDLQFGPAIPEFGSIVGLFVAGSAVACVAMIVLRRKS